MTPKELNNYPVLGTAVDLITAVALNVIGNEVSNEVGGQKMTQNAVRILATSTLNKVLTEKVRHD